MNTPPEEPSVPLVRFLFLNKPLCHTLPLPLQHVVAEVRQLTQADDAIIINSMLSAMSAAVQASTDIIHPFTKNPIPLSLYLITVADTCTRKTAVDDIFMAPFHHFDLAQESGEGVLSIRYEHENEIYKIRRKSIESDLRKAIKSGNKDDEDNLTAALLAHNKSKPTIASSVRILVSDVTQPALLKALGRPWNKLCLNNDDAGKILNGKDFSLPSFYNSLWNSTPQYVERITSGGQQVRNYRFCMNLMLQPFAFSKYIRLHGDEAKQSGFFGRCLFSFASPSHKMQAPTEKIETPNLDSFIARVTTLLNIANHKFQCGQLDERRLLSLVDNTIILEFETQKENDRFGLYSSEPQFIQRATEHALRLAGVMHAFLSEDDSVIVKNHIFWSACEMSYVFATRYQEAITYNELSEALIQKLLAFIKNNARRNPTINYYAVNKSLLLQFGPTGLKKKEPLDAALAILEARQEIRMQRIHNGYYIIPVHYDHFSGFALPSPNQPSPTWGQQ